MPIDINDTQVELSYPCGASGKKITRIAISRLAGNSANISLKLIADTGDDNDYLELAPVVFDSMVLLQCWLPDGRILKGTKLSFHFSFTSVMRKEIQRDASKVASKWLFAIGLTNEEFALLCSDVVKRITIRNKQHKLRVNYVFSNQPQLHYEDERQGRKLLQLMFSRLLEERKSIYMPHHPPRLAVRRCSTTSII